MAQGLQEGVNRPRLVNKTDANSQSKQAEEREYAQIDRKILIGRGRQARKIKRK